MGSGLKNNSFHYRQKELNEYFNAFPNYKHSKIVFTNR